MLQGHLMIAVIFCCFVVVVDNLCVGGGCFLQKGLSIDAEDEKI